MKLRTTLPLKKAPFSLQHTDKILAIGSCFAENIGQRMQERKFTLFSNPFGVLYNPLSLFKNLNKAYKHPSFSEDSLMQREEIWYSFDHHSQFSGIDKRQVSQNIQQQFTATHQHLKNIDKLIITFGSAFIYVFKETGQIVANCHKLPAAAFDKKRLTVAEIVSAALLFLTPLKNSNPNLEVILTVSPVRHIKDGIIENQQSKAILLLAAADICQQLSFTHYFPAYEYLMDDLRDYRFYATDLVHPNQLAIQYIWERFTDTYFKQPTGQLIQQIEKIIAAAKHRPFHPHAHAHQQFLQKQLLRIKQLNTDYPYLNFTVEQQVFRQQLKAT